LAGTGRRAILGELRVCGRRGRTRGNRLTGIDGYPELERQWLNAKAKVAKLVSSPAPQFTVTSLIERD